MKVSELQGASLDYWVGKAEGLAAYIYDGRCFLKASQRNCQRNPGGDYSPSTDWSQGGPIIEREHINIDCLNDNSGQWMACMPPQYGSTPLIAAMRCFIASVYGDEAPD